MHSIRTQFLVFIVLLLAALLILLNSYPLISARDLVFEEKKSAMSSQAAVLSSSLSGLEQLSVSGVEEVLRLLDTTGYDRIVVADETGELVFDSLAPTGEESGQLLPADETEDVSRALAGELVFRSDFDGESFRSACAIPIYRQGATTGAVYLYEEDSERAELILGLQSRIRTISVGIAVLALLLSLAFTGLLLKRIWSLVGSMHVVAGGDYKHRHTVTGKDEISELGEEFNQLTERLEETEEQRRRFVSDASHELKTPIASIRLLADSVVENENVDLGTAREFMADIGSEAARLQRTAEKLLDLSRLDNDAAPPPEPVDAARAASRALAVLQPLAEQKNVSLSGQLDERCTVMATQDALYHILFNLIENAIKYNVPGGSVSVELKRGLDSVTLTVSDTGIGIPEKDRQNVFSRFYRVDKARSREAGGSGLGLSIVHDAVLTYGGSIAVESNTPRGTRFVVRFPRHLTEEKTP